MIARTGIACLAVAVLAAFAVAGTRAEDPPKKRTLEQRIEVEGTVVCLGCALEQQENGADAQCTLYAKHAQGLQLADGTLWTFVDNTRGHALITNEKLRGKTVKVLGWKFPKAQYLEVWKYSLKKGDAWESWDYCKTCGFEPGDNQGKDLCADCAGE